MSRKDLILAAALLVGAAAAGAQTAAPKREPASKAAAILTWSSELRERYIAALDSFFLTRTVKAGPHPYGFERGRPLASFETGGPRADSFDRFMNAQRVRGVLVLHDGRIRLERYVSPHSSTTRWNSFSVAKSITSTLVGAAMKDGYIRSLDDDLTRYIGALRGSAYDGVTVRQLLTMTSGVKWNEDYTDMNSDVARMYAQPSEPGFDMTVSYVRKLPREAPPGTKWVYKTSETNLVGVLVAEATGKPLADYLSEKIWRPYGMERDAEWMIDDVGHEQGGCCIAVTLRDYGRFGQFVLDGARIDGKPIVPDTWLAEATRSQVPAGAASGYGYQWWPRDNGTFEGRGIYGQTLHIDPARRLVIVINSATEQPTDRAAGQARQEFIAAVKAELDAEKPGQAAPQSPQIGATAAVTDVTQAPRAAEIEFVAFEFHQPRPMHGGVGLFGIDGEPASGTRYPVEAVLGGEESLRSVSFDVIAEDGTIIEPLLIARRGTSGSSRFIGMMTVPARPFRILLTGQTVDGRGFRSILERPFTPVKGPADLRPAGPIPPEFGGQRRLMDEEAARLVAEVESYAVDHATVPLVMPRIQISKVMYAPLLSAAGRPIGVRVTYDVEFSHAGLYNPQVFVHPEALEESSGVLSQMRVLNSRLEPLPRLDHPPHAPADTRTSESVLAYGADFLYEARTIYHFSVDLVPGFIITRQGAAPCVWQEGFRTASDPDEAFAAMQARESPRPYMVHIGRGTFEGRIETLPGEGTLYRSFVAEGAQECARAPR